MWNPHTLIQVPVHKEFLLPKRNWMGNWLLDHVCWPYVDIGQFIPQFSPFCIKHWNSNQLKIFFLLFSYLYQKQGQKFKSRLWNVIKNIFRKMLFLKNKSDLMWPGNVFVHCSRNSFPNEKKSWTCLCLFSVLIRPVINN